MDQGLLSNHNESSCVRCITAARYATYGLEKRRLDNPGKATVKVTCWVQSHLSVEAMTALIRQRQMVRLLLKKTMMYSEF